MNDAPIVSGTIVRLTVWICQLLPCGVREREPLEEALGGPRFWLLYLGNKTP